MKSVVAQYSCAEEKHRRCGIFVAQVSTLCYENEIKVSSVWRSMSIGILIVAKVEMVIKRSTTFWNYNSEILKRRFALCTAYAQILYT